MAHDVVLLRSSKERAGDVGEEVRTEERPAAYVERVSLAKAAFGARAIALRGLPTQPLLAADTTVCLGDEILGKPGTAAEAAAMLGRLSGTSHNVFTAVAMQLGERVETRTSCSNVKFRQLTSDEIHQYVQRGESFDKAGAYAIQGRAAVFVAELHGSYSGVMGLPLFETAELLSLFGYRI